MITWFKALDRVLKGEATKAAALRGGTIDLPTGGITALLVILGGVYGGCMGSFAVVSRWGTTTQASGWLQMGYSAAKVPMLFLLTLVITFPSLYVFNALVGSRLAFSAVLRLLVGALGVTLAVLASFGTIVVFFSLCTTSYPFMVLLNVLLFAVAGLLGMNFLLQTLHRLAAAKELIAWEQGEAPEASATQVPPVPPLPAPHSLERRTGAPPVRTVFFAWVIVFGLVGAQMGWVLRPFIGAPHAPVTFFRPREGNFFQAVGDKIQDLATGERQHSPGQWQRPATEP